MSINFFAAPCALRIAMAMAAILLPAAARAAEQPFPITLDAMQVCLAGFRRVQAEKTLTPPAITVLDGDHAQIDKAPYRAKPAITDNLHLLAEQLAAAERQVSAERMRLTAPLTAGVRLPAAGDVAHEG